MEISTPSKSTKTVFSPIKLRESPIAASPQKNLTGLPRIVADVTADIYNTIQKWNGHIITGSEIVKRIASLKADNPKSLDSALEKLTENLYDLVQDMRKYVDAIIGFTKQIESVVKLNKDSSQPMFMSCNVESIKKMVGNLCRAYETELEMKVCVLENIAHTENESEAMFLAAVWTYETKISDDVLLNLTSLLVETGHWRFS